MNTTYKKFVTKEEINALPMLEYGGRIELIDTHAHAHQALIHLKHEKILGFDTESRPSFKKGESYGVALLQLATKDTAYLFRVSKMPPLQELSDLLSNPEVTKVGLAIHDDVKGLQKILPALKPHGFVDLAKEAEKKGFTSLGLRPLTAIFLEMRLSKGAKVTNWDRTTLTEAQLKYAASDALVGLLIYEKLLALN